MSDKTKKDDLTLTVSFMENIPFPLEYETGSAFYCEIKGTSIGTYGLTVVVPYFKPSELPKEGVILQAPGVLKMGRQDRGHQPLIDLIKAIGNCTLTKNEYNIFSRFWPDIRKPNDKEVRYFSEILARALEEVGYTVTIEIEDYYFPSPTSLAFISPAFTLGLKKTVEPIKTDEDFEITYVYLSHEKPQSKTQIQLKVFDHIPEERLNEIQRNFKDNLTPYGLKCLYLVIAECAHNKRNPWFVLDTNKSLDMLGYKRNNKKVHQAKNRKKLLKELDSLTQINFNIERRQPKKKTKNKDSAIRFQSPLLSITGKFEEWEVKKDQPIETGKRIKENIQIFIHPEIYKYIDSWYTVIPHAFLTIDPGRRPHAIMIYSYIANQWRIGWNRYKGIIKQPMRQILEGSGLLNRLPRRRNQQRDFVEGIKDDLKWLKGQPEYWIQDVKIEDRKKPFLEEMITIIMADDHPARNSMKKQIEG